MLLKFLTYIDLLQCMLYTFHSVLFCQLCSNNDTHLAQCIGLSIDFIEAIKYFIANGTSCSIVLNSVWQFTFLGRLLQVDLIKWVLNVRPFTKVSSISLKFGM